ncbi:MAG: fasciclin domain-containing protein [Candidatus Promineifilaceae bacterium]
MSLTRDISDILAECFDAIDAEQATVEDCLQKYPERHDELAALLAMRTVLHDVTQDKSVAPSAEFRANARASLLSKLEARQAPTTTRNKPVKPVRSWSWSWFTLRRSSLVRWALVLMMVTTLFGSVTGGTIYASERSLPGATLYPVKTGIEQYRLSRTETDTESISLQLNFAGRRVDEIEQLVERGDGEHIASTSKAYATLLDQVVEQVDQIEVSSEREALTTNLQQTAELHQSRLLEMDGAVDVLAGLAENSDEANPLDFATGALDSVQTYVNTGLRVTADSEPRSIFETIADHEQYAAFVELLMTSDLQMMLTENAPFTVFVPLEAYESFTSMEDEKLRRQRVLYHIGRGNLSVEDLAESGELLTALGNSISITVIEGEPISLNGSARIVASDIVATNGIIHFIDLPLTPPSYYP